MRLTFIRHGESTANREQRLQGQLDYPLSEEGERQGLAIGTWLSAASIDVLYTSDLLRARETAVYIARHHRHSLSVQTREDLREIHFGPFQGKTKEELRGRYPDYDRKDWLTSGLAGVEQISQLQHRARGVIDDLLSKHYGEDVYCVSHGGFISIILQTVLNMPWQKDRTFAIDNTALTTVQFRKDGRIVVCGVNERPHLQCNFNKVFEGSRSVAPKSVDSASTEPKS